jgi:hypothetical protein
MRLISRLLGSVALLCIAMFTAEAATRDRAGSLDWQMFQVPEYGTHVEYSASLFAPVGESEKGVGQRFEREDGRAVLSIYARENQDDDTPASYLRTNLRQPMLDYERVSRSFFAISMERGGTILLADATSLLAVPPYIVSTWCIQKAKKGLGPCGNTHQSLTAAA